MCRWLAYYGDPIPIEALILRRKHSLIDQSLHSRDAGADPTNGDGFGVGWYDELGGMPGLYKSIQPAWNDRNLRELATHISSPLFFAHIRASTGTAVQETNSHPFRHGRWLFMHNGYVREFPRMRRDLLLAVDPALFPHIEGSGDSEVLFHLALTFGLEDDPLTAIERMAGFVEEVGERHGVAESAEDDHSCERRRTDHRRPLFERWSAGLPLLQHRCAGSQGATPGHRGASGALERDARDRLGTTRRSRWSMERTTRVVHRGRQARPGRALPVHPSPSGRRRVVPKGEGEPPPELSRDSGERSALAYAVSEQLSSEERRP